jgi:hypothetical protein
MRALRRFLYPLLGLCGWLPALRDDVWQWRRYDALFDVWRAKPMTEAEALRETWYRAIK